MMGMDNPPSSTVLKQLLKTPHSWGGGSAVQGLHIYGSVVGGAGGDSSEQIELDYFTGAVEGMAVEGPMTIRGGGLRPQLRLGRLHFQLLRDFECWMSHCNVISAGGETSRHVYHLSRYIQNLFLCGLM